MLWMHLLQGTARLLALQRCILILPFSEGEMRKMDGHPFLEPSFSKISL